MPGATVFGVITQGNASCSDAVQFAVNKIGAANVRSEKTVEFVSEQFFELWIVVDNVYECPRCCQTNEGACAVDRVGMKRTDILDVVAMPD